MAAKEHLREEHIRLHEKEEALIRSLESNEDIATVRKAFEAYEQANLEHLKKEEDIMMPRVSEMAQTGHNLKTYMKEDILGVVVDSPDFENFVKYANDVLERHPEGMPRVRVFDHALWAVATPEQWKQWDQWIKETISDSSYKELYNAIHS